MQAFHDDLTGLANRALFKDRVEHALTRRSKDRRLVALLFLDVDRFKTVNDSLGHTVGDGLLVAIARRLHTVLRPEDTIARLGGDEFGVLVDDPNTPQQVLALAERISASFDSPFELDEREITIRCSIGVVLAAGGHRSADDLLRDADVAMYRAKLSGRGSYALFESSMQAEVAARLEVEPTSARPSITSASRSSTSRSSISAMAASSRSRHWPAGRIRSAVTCHRRSSSPVPRKAV